MNRKTPALTALSLAALLPLAGCAAVAQAPLDYLKGTWECSGGSKHGNFYDPGIIAMAFDGDRITLESDNEDANAFLPDLVVGEFDGYVSIEAPIYNPPLILDLPDVMPEDGVQIVIPAGSTESGISSGAHYIAIADSSTFTLALIDTTDGKQVWSSGTCVKQ